jgi:hypothetical protein
MFSHHPFFLFTHMLNLFFALFLGLLLLFHIFFMQGSSAYLVCDLNVVIGNCCVRDLWLGDTRSRPIRLEGHAKSPIIFFLNLLMIRGRLFFSRLTLGLFNFSCCWN